MTSLAVTQPKKSQPVPWWMVLLAGVAAGAFGIAMLVLPKTSSPLLFQILGGVVLIGGLVVLASILFNRAHWGSKLLLAGILLLIGAALVVQPIFSAYLASGLLVWMIGAALLGLGWALLILAFSYAGWLYGIGGIVSLIAGLAFVLGAALGPQIAPWLFGIVATVGGIGAAAGGFQMRKTRVPAAQA